MGIDAPRVLAFYLPQFHPIPENDRWWGRGFTEWTNVAKARPLFAGHEQPHLPADLGFYDLRIPEVREAQADMARTHGIDAFCYYHYWFDGVRLLHRPFDEVLASGRPDFPFCLCWANENWTRSWDGTEAEILMPQRHSAADDLAHVEHLLPAFADPRYLRVGGRPLLLVYRTELLPEPERTAERWRTCALRAGVGDLYLARVESFVSGVDPRRIGFDAAVEFAPDWHVLPWAPYHRPRPDLVTRVQRGLGRAGLIERAYLLHSIHPYDVLVERMRAKPPVDYPRFRCVTPRWDNSPRRLEGGFVFRDSTPAKYEAWLRATVADTRAAFRGDERLVFVNAWNEWGEGSHLEPEERWGLGYLEATRRALGRAEAGDG